jgi:hypothetical protein
MDSKATVRLPTLALCPRCGHQYTANVPCLRCGYDPFAPDRIPCGFESLTPVGTARMEGALIGALIRMILDIVRRRQRRLVRDSTRR